MNGLDPWAYPKAVLSRLPGHLNSRIDELQFHRWQLAGRGFHQTAAYFGKQGQAGMTSRLPRHWHRQVGCRQCGANVNDGCTRARPEEADMPTCRHFAEEVPPKPVHWPDQPLCQRRRPNVGEELIGYRAVPRPAPDHAGVASLRPITPATINPRLTRRPVLVESPSSTMPRMAVPTAPIPTQIAWLCHR